MLIASLKLLVVILVFFCVFLPGFFSFGNVYRPKRPVLGTPRADGFKYDSVSLSTTWVGLDAHPAAKSGAVRRLRALSGPEFASCT